MLTTCVDMIQGLLIAAATAHPGGLALLLAACVAAGLAGVARWGEEWQESSR